MVKKQVLPAGILSMLIVILANLSVEYRNLGGGATETLSALRGTHSGAKAGKPRARMQDPGLVAAELTCLRAKRNSAEICLAVTRVQCMPTLKDYGPRVSSLSTS